MRTYLSYTLLALMLLSFGILCADAIWYQDAQISSLSPNIASVIYPENQAVNVSTLTHLTWSYNGPNIDGYYVSLGTDNPPTNILHNLEVTDCALSLINYLHPSIQYYWQVVPFNENGTPNSCPVWSFQTNMDYDGLNVPYYENVDCCQVNSLPSGWLTEDVDHNGCSWHMVNGIANTGVNSIKIECSGENTIDDWLISPPILLETGIEYCFRAMVKAEMATDSSLLTVLWGDSPLTEDMQNSGNYTLWMVNSSDFVNYSYVVSPTETGIYYFAIQANNQGLTTDIWIDDLQVVNNAYSDLEELPIPRPRLGIIKSIYPNPVMLSSTVQYELNKSEHVTLELYNIRGQKVLSQDLGTKTSGSHSTELDLDTLGIPSGIYYLRMSSGQDISQRKLMYLPK